MERCYAVLGLTPDASPEEIEGAYRTLRSRYHPDRYESEGAEAVLRATERLKEINFAYQEALKMAGVSGASTSEDDAFASVRNQSRPTDELDDDEDEYAAIDERERRSAGERLNEALDREWVKDYDLSEAWLEVLTEPERMDKAKAAARFLGKTGFNAAAHAGRFAFEILRKKVGEAIDRGEELRRENGPRRGADPGKEFDEF